MDNTVKVNFVEAFKLIFGLEKKDNNIKEIEKEVERINAISDGISPEEWEKISLEKLKNKNNKNQNIENVPGKKQYTKSRKQQPQSTIQRRQQSDDYIQK